MIKKLVKYGSFGREDVILDNAGIHHDCLCEVGVMVRYCVKCRRAYDDPTEWEADDHQTEQGHWVPWCLFCRSCEKLIFEGFEAKGPFYLFVVNLKEGLRLAETSRTLKVFGRAVDKLGIPRSSV